MTSLREVQLKLSMRERQLLCEYGYPFEELGEQLEMVADVKGAALLTTDDFYLEQLIGNLVISAKETDEPELLCELDALCTELETQAAASAYKA